MVGGAVWYGVFAKPWMAESGLTREWLEENKNVQYKGYAIAIGASIVIAFALAVLIQATPTTEALDGLAWGLIAGVGFVGTTQAASYAFENKTLRHYLINVGYPVVMFGIIGVLFAAWQ